MKLIRITEILKKTSAVKNIEYVAFIEYLQSITRDEYYIMMYGEI